MSSAMQYNFFNDYNNIFESTLNFAYNKNDSFNNQNDLKKVLPLITFDNSGISNQNNFNNPFENFESSKSLSLSESNEENSRIYFNTNSYSNNINRDINEQPIKVAKRKTHKGGDVDNILRKIQVHFLSFIIDFSNEVIDAMIDADNSGDVPKFMQLDYNIKKDIKYKNLESFKKKSIGYILKLNVTSKFKKKDINENKYSYNKICAMCQSIKNYFNKNYLEIFQDYYYKDNNKFVEINGKIIPLSGKTKTFKDLISKHIQYEKELKLYAIKYFINSHKKFQGPYFQIDNYKNSN